MCSAQRFERGMGRPACLLRPGAPRVDTHFIRQRSPTRRTPPQLRCPAPSDIARQHNRISSADRYDCSYAQNNPPWSRAIRVTETVPASCPTCRSTPSFRFGWRTTTLVRSTDRSYRFVAELRKPGATPGGRRFEERFLTSGSWGRIRWRHQCRAAANGFR